MVIVASTRPGRIGKPVSDWIAAEAAAEGTFAVDMADLAEIDLPMFDEPAHPRLGEFEHAHTRAWSERVGRADAFVFVTPEYNHGLNAALKNAIDYLHVEWNYKPAGIVSYGGVSAGVRAAQMLKQVLAAVRVYVVAEAVPIPFVAQFLDAEGGIEANPLMVTAAQDMFTELNRTSVALAGLRQKQGD